MKKRVLILSLALSGIVIALAILPSCLMWSQGGGEQQRVIEIEVPQNVIEATNRLTGLNELQNVHIMAEQVVIKEEEDDSPIPAIHSRIVGRPLFRVTYTASLPEWRGKRNPDIQAFDVFLDAEDLSLLKVVSRWGEDIDPRYKEGARISRKEIASDVDSNQMASDTLPKELPQFRPIDGLRAGGLIHVKHMEWYYFITGEKYIQEFRNIPTWLFITHGGPPHIPVGAPWEAVERILEQARLDYVRVARYWLSNALTGDEIISAEMLGTNTEDF